MNPLIWLGNGIKLMAYQINDEDFLELGHGSSLNIPMRMIQYLHQKICPNLYLRNKNCSD